MGKIPRNLTEFSHNRLTNFYNGLRLWLNRLKITAKRFNLPTLIQMLYLNQIDERILSK